MVMFEYVRLRAVSLFLQIKQGTYTRTQDARNEGGSLSRLAPSVARVVICVSWAFCSTGQEKRETSRSLEYVDFLHFHFRGINLSNMRHYY